MRRFVFLMAAAIAALAAGSASAATWTVYGGLPLKRPPEGTPKQADVEQFAPLAITINAGDKILFKTTEGHTVTFPGKRPLASLEFALPDPAGSTYSGINDAAGNPFYFDGLTKWLYNAPLLLEPSGSAQVANNAAYHNRLIFGADPPDKPQSATLTFPKPGVYRYLCLFHNLMKGTVVVKPKGVPVQSPTAVTASIARQITKDVATLRALAKTKPSADPATVWMGVGNANQVSLDVFVPDKLTVPVGTTVTFVVKSPSQSHNVAFGPLPWLKKFSETQDLFPFGPPGTPNQVLPTFIYGSDPADPTTGVYSYDGTSHGNGVFITSMNDKLGPVLDLAPINVPDTTKITFTKAGTYHFICQLHGPDMSGDITVTG